MKVTFDLMARKIVIEGEEPQLVDLLQKAREIAPFLPKIEILTGQSLGDVSEPINRITAQDNGQLNGDVPGTLKQFVRSLRLDNTAERIAAIAFYMRTHENRDTFSPKDMDSWFTIAGFQKPKVMPVAVFDTKRKYGYLDSGGHAKWKLTSQGENVVTRKLNQAEREE